MLQKSQNICSEKQKLFSHSPFANLLPSPLPANVFILIETTTTVSFKILREGNSEALRINGNDNYNSTQ